MKMVFKRQLTLHVTHFCRINPKKRIQKKIKSMSNPETSVLKSTIGVFGKKIKIIGNVNINKQSRQMLKIDDEFHLPPLITTFNGRDSELNNLSSLFFEKNCKNVVLCGLPGFGKTECAKQFAKRAKTATIIDKIFWMNAETNELLIQSFKELGKCIDILYSDDKTLIKDIYEYFKDSKCLFVFDNAICRRSITGFEPTNGHLLLVTSQEKDWGEDFISIQLDTLTPESAITVLKSILTDKYKDKYFHLYEQLASMVSWVPLGLQITGGYVRHHTQLLGDEFNITDYINTLRVSQEKIMKIKIPSSIPNTYQKSIYGAVKVSLDKISNEDDNERKEHAFEILFICSFLNPDVELFYNINRILSYPGIQLQLALGLITNFSFVYFTDKNKSLSYIRIHRLTQDILRFYFNTNNCEIKTKCYTKCLRYILDDDNTDVRHKLINFNSILKYADENSTVTFNFYKNYSPSVRPVQGAYNTFKNILLRLTENGCSESLLKIFEDINDSSKEYIHKYKLLYKAAENQHLNVLKVLLRYVNINSTDKDGNTTLHTAACVWDLNTIKFLVQNNANINIKNNYGDTPLFHFLYGASFKKQIIINEVNQILKLLQCEENKKVVNNNNETLLHAAAFSCCEQLILKLIKDYKLDVNKQDKCGNTPLHTCTFYLALNPELKHVKDSIKALVENGASVIIKNKKGFTPLHLFMKYMKRRKKNNFDYDMLRVIKTLLQEDQSHST